MREEGGGGRERGKAGEKRGKRRESEGRTKEIYLLKLWSYLVYKIMDWVS